jgi:hypothetical protein
MPDGAEAPTFKQRVICVIVWYTRSSATLFLGHFPLNTLHFKYTFSLVFFLDTLCSVLSQSRILEVNPGNMPAALATANRPRAEPKTSQKAAHDMDRKRIHKETS